MTLISARSLEEYLDDGDEFGASGLRETRRAYREARRRNRRVEKQHELEAKTRALNQETRRTRRADRKEAHQPAKPAASRVEPSGGRRLERSDRFPRVAPSGRGPQIPPRGPLPRGASAREDAWRAPPEPPDEAPPEPEDWSEPEGFEEEPLPEDLSEPLSEDMPEEGVAGRLREPAWGAPVEASPRVRVQARRGHRAAVLEIQPGLYLVSEFPEDAEFGLVPVIATLMVRSAARALVSPPAEPERRPLLELLRRRQPTPQPAPSTALVAVQAPLPPLGASSPGDAPAVGWIHPDDAADLFGCAACRKRR